MRHTRRWLAVCLAGLASACSGSGPTPTTPTSAGATTPSPAAPSPAAPPTDCDSRPVYTDADRSACVAAGCVVVSAARVDERAHCLAETATVACMSPEPCDDVLTLAREPRPPEDHVLTPSRLFRFSDGCVPPEWSRVDGDAELPPCAAPTAAFGPPAGELAVESYRAALAAYNDGDQERYFTWFADTLTCFHGARDVPLAHVRERRAADFESGRFLHTREIEVVAELPEGVLLLDRGADFVELEGPAAASSQHASHRASASPIRAGTHEKLVLMIPGVRGAFRIGAETSAREPGCLSAPTPVSPSTELAACGAAAQRCTAECDDWCSAPAPGNACNECPAGCARALATCVGASVPFLE